MMPRVRLLTVCLSILPQQAAAQDLPRIPTPIMVRQLDRQPVAAATVTLLGRVSMFPTRSAVVDRIEVTTDARGRARPRLREGIHYVGWATSMSADGSATFVSDFESPLIPGAAIVFDLDAKRPLAPRRVVLTKLDGWQGPIAVQLLLEPDSSPLSLDLEPVSERVFAMPILPNLPLRVQIYETLGMGSCGFARSAQSKAVEEWNCELPSLTPQTFEARGGQTELPIAGSRVGVVENGVWRELGVTDEAGEFPIRFSSGGSIERGFAIGPGAHGAAPTVRSPDGTRLIARTRGAEMFRFRLVRSERPFHEAHVMIRQFGLHVQSERSHSLAVAWRDVRPDPTGIITFEGIHADQSNLTFLEFTEAGLGSLPTSLRSIWPVIPSPCILNAKTPRTEDQPTELDLDRMMPIEWIVTRSDGTPAVGAWIAIVGLPQRGAVAPSRTLPVAITGRDGSLRMLLPSRRDLVVAVAHDSGGALIGIRTADGSLDEVQTFPVRLEQPVVVVGRVEDQNGRPVPGAMVTCHPGWEVVEQVDAEIPPVIPAGDVTDITLQLPGYAYLGMQDHFLPPSRRADATGAFEVRLPIRGRGWGLSAGGERVTIDAAALGRSPIKLVTAK